MPLNIPTSCRTLNWPSFSWKGQESEKEEGSAGGCEMLNTEWSRDRTLSHPEERIQRSVLHELCDDPLRRAAGDHALQLQDVGVVKLAQDPGFTQEHALLTVRCPPAKCFHGHQHFAATQRAVTAAGHLPKLSWTWRESRSQLFSGYQETNKITLLLSTGLPAPITSSILRCVGSISRANSLTASLGSSYVDGST